MIGRRFAAWRRLRARRRRERLAVRVVDMIRDRLIVDLGDVPAAALTTAARVALDEAGGVDRRNLDAVLGRVVELVETDRRR